MSIDTLPQIQPELFSPGFTAEINNLDGLYNIAKGQGAIISDSYIGGLIGCQSTTLIGSVGNRRRAGIHNGQDAIICDAPTMFDFRVKSHVINDIHSPVRSDAGLFDPVKMKSLQDTFRDPAFGYFTVPDLMHLKEGKISLAGYNSKKATSFNITAFNPAVTGNNFMKSGLHIEFGIADKGFDDNYKLALPQDEWVFDDVLGSYLETYTDILTVLYKDAGFPVPNHTIVWEKV